MKSIIAIDPGTEKSAYVIWDGSKYPSIKSKGILDNDDLLLMLRSPVRDYIRADIMVIEEVCSYGMAVGREVFETVFWSGRFAEAWQSRGRNYDRMPRLQVKMFWCHNARAKDTNVWQAMVDRFGAPGKKSAPGFLYGVTSHERAALALAIAFAEREA